MSGYLDMDCLNCGRHRVQENYICDKCRYDNKKMEYCDPISDSEILNNRVQYPISGNSDKAAKEDNSIYRGEKMNENSSKLSNKNEIAKEQKQKLSIWLRLAKWIKNHRLFRIRFQSLGLYTNGYDTYVAFSSEDAEKAYEEFVGEPMNKDGEPWRTISLSAQLPIYSEDNLKHYPVFAKIKKNEYGGWIVIAPAWAWILDNGRGFLASTEY